MKPALLLICSGDRNYREYMLNSISRHSRVTLLSPYPPSWESDYIADHMLIDPENQSSAIAAAHELFKKHSIAGVLTYHEPCVELATEIASILGLPHCPADAATICRDKFGAREAFRRGDVPSAKCRLVKTLSEAQLAAEEISYPVVVKPRALCASFGVSLVETESELAGAFASAQSSKLPEAWAHRDGVLVEEYLDGPEISVDGVIQGGKVTPLLYAKKLLGFAPFFEEIGHIVAPFDAVTENQEEILDVIVRAHQALGIDNLTTHTEIRLTSRGPRIIEVNGRAGGDLIPYVGLLASGLDIGGAAADVALGTELEIPAAIGGIGGIRFFYPGSAGHFQSVAMSLGPQRPPWLLEFTNLVEQDTELNLTPGEYIFSRVGFAIVSGKTFEECEARLEAVSRAVTIETRAVDIASRSN